MANPVIILFAGPAVALFYLFRMIYWCILFFLLIYIAIKLIKKSYKKAIITGTIFFILATPGAILAYGEYSVKKEASVKFLGDYKLNRLDGEDCINCKVKLHNNYRYDIYVGDKIVGRGKWNVRSAYDIPGWFLEIEYGPRNVVIRESSRLIQYIDRTDSKWYHF